MEDETVSLDRVLQLLRGHVSRQVGRRNATMGMSYTHLLIPRRADYKPRPSQVARFLLALSQLGASPVNARLQMRRDKPTKKGNWIKRERQGQLGEASFLLRDYFVRFKAIAEILSGIERLNEYKLEMCGQGPPRLSPFDFDQELLARFEFDPSIGPYEFTISCCLKSKIVSPTGLHEVTTERTGLFINPQTGETIEVREAGRARFWVEFNFDKWLFPKIVNNRLDVLPQSIVMAAEQTFEVAFSQDCNWG